jgi:hypothetical protein
MNCPRCNTENEPSAQYCISCAYPLQSTPQKAQVVSSGTYLLLMTIRFLIAIFGAWILEQILISLPFVISIQIPRFPLTVTDIINLVIAVLMVIFLISYSISLSRTWPKTFPKFTQVGTLLSGIVYLIILVVLYLPLEPIFEKIFTYPYTTTAVLILQISFALIALVLMIWLAVILYHALPSWLVNLRHAMIQTQGEDFQISDRK